MHLGYLSGNCLWVQKTTTCYVPEFFRCFVALLQSMNRIKDPAIGKKKTGDISRLAHSKSGMPPLRRAGERFRLLLKPHRTRGSHPGALDGPRRAFKQGALGLPSRRACVSYCAVAHMDENQCTKALVSRAAAEFAIFWRSKRKMVRYISAVRRHFPGAGALLLAAGTSAQRGTNRSSAVAHLEQNPEQKS